MKREHLSTAISLNETYATLTGRCEQIKRILQEGKEAPINESPPTSPFGITIAGYYQNDNFVFACLPAILERLEKERDVIAAELIAIGIELES